jgi:hypothetical protein
MGRVGTAASIAAATRLGDLNHLSDEGRVIEPVTAIAVRIGQITLAVALRGRRPAG